MVYVYILRRIEEPDRFYVGIAKNLKSRFKQHNAGDVFHTAKFKPWRVKNYIAFDDDQKAHAFERYLKNGSGRAFAKKHF